MMKKILKKIFRILFARIFKTLRKIYVVVFSNEKRGSGFFSFLGDLIFRIAKKLIRVESRLRRSVKPDDKFAKYYAFFTFLVGIVFFEAKKWSKAESCFRRSVELNGKAARHYIRLAMTSRKQAKWWQEVEALESAIALDANQPQWHYNLGAAREHMNRFEQAAQSFRRAVEFSTENYMWYYRLGYAMELSGDVNGAALAYKEAIRLDISELGEKFGIGAYHQNRQIWQPAIKEYSALLTTGKKNGELYYRLGNAYDKNYRWVEAAESYQNAINIEPGNACWNYRLGLVLERDGKWLEAAAAYERTTELYSCSVESVDVYYRLGYVFNLAERFEDACVAFLQTGEAKSADSTEDCASHSATEIKTVHGTEADFYYQKGCKYEREENWQKAADNYHMAVSRSDFHAPLWFYRLGSVLYRAGKFKKACNAFIETRILKRPYASLDNEYNRNAALRQCVNYTEYYECCTVQDKVILYESFHGASMSCNPYAIFKHIFEKEEFKDWIHIWVVNSSDKIPQQYLKKINVIFVTRGRDLYLRYLCQAKVLINNNTFPTYFIRKPEQIYLNTWHGIPIKTLGKDLKVGFHEHKNAARNLLQATHIISPNEHTTHVLINQYDIKGIHTAIVAQTGYPRVDATLDADRASAEVLKKRLDIKEKQKVLLYAPTYRGSSLGTSEFDADIVHATIKRLTENNCKVLFRGHHLTEAAIAKFSIAEHVVPGDIDTNELLAVVDILITDYSSIAFDFMPTGKPIVHYLYDLESYQQERGLYFPMDEIPGHKCTSLTELVDTVDDILAAESIEIVHDTNAQKRFWPNEDGHATSRVVDLLFYDKKAEVKILQPEKRKTLLFFAGAFLPNGITNSFLNLTSNIDSSKYRIVLAIDPNSIGKFSDRREQFARMPEYVQVHGRCGRMNTTLEEKNVLAVFNTLYNLANMNMWELFEKSFKREFSRLYGATRFDTLVAFEGYNNFWTSFFSCIASPKELQRVIYLHNDMYGEWKTRFPILERSFRRYHKYDAMISVSKQTGIINRDNLASRFSLDAEKFLYCDNVFDYQLVLDLSQEPIADPDTARLFDTKGPKFITMGRLSPEKDHAKLIKSFAQIYSENKEARLFILGDGPLYPKLRNFIHERGLDSAVYLLGRHYNPFPFIRKADCFVLSSKYEGQGLVLLEAMTLGLPVICTDFPPAHDVLNDDLGLIVENSEEGLVFGMRRFLDQKLVSKPFDYKKYTQNALSQLAKNVIDRD